MDFEGVFFDTNDYVLTKKKLGEGMFGTVYVAKNLKDEKEYAAKIIDIRDGFNGHQQMLFLRESLILHNLKHPAIIKFKGINFQSFSDSQKLQPTIITEYMSNGSLKENLDKERTSLCKFEWDPTKKYIIILGISNAMKYLHQNGIIHRDLKPENILNDSVFYPRVSDFGLARCLPENLSKSMKLALTGQIGTPLYMAPELLRGENNYDKSVDVYSFGILAYEIVTGEEPFADLGKISAFQFAREINNGYRPKFKPGKATEKMEMLISSCWDDDPDKRPTFDEIFEKLSNDFSYFIETVDKDEVNAYIESLEDEEIDQTEHVDKVEKKLIVDDSINQNKNQKQSFIFVILAALVTSFLIVTFLFQIGFIQRKEYSDATIDKLKIEQKNLTNKIDVLTKEYDKKQNELLEIDKDYEMLLKEIGINKTIASKAKRCKVPASKIIECRCNFESVCTELVLCMKECIKSFS